MSSTEDKSSRRESSEIVRLKVDGARSVVNTLRDQQTARGISLVCPFPALEVEIPVSFGTGPSDSLRRGTVHRIGVEDDPETGLPRLRLSIRAHESRATVIAPPTASLLDEASRMTPAPAEQADTDLSVESEVTEEDNSLEDLFDGDPLELELPPEQSSIESTDEPTFLPLLEQEPAWVGCGELSLPDEIAKRSRNRARRRLASVAAWMMVLGVAAGGCFVLNKAGIVDIAALRDKLAGFVNTAEPSDEPLLAVVEPVATPEPSTSAALPDTEDVSELAVVSDVAFEQVSGPESSLPEPFEEDESAEDSAPVEEQSAIPTPEPTGTDPAETAAASPAPGEPEEPADTADEVNLMLPTRWPAEYANAYRMRDPNGVVVDVPGGLVRREGWLDIAGEHPMVKSIKAVQRETGARFVIFVNGELPRFMTVPRPGGISVKLYREVAVEPAETEQVALID